MRLAYSLGLLIVCLILGTSIYFQLADGIIPCPLCTLQRISFGLLGICCLLGLWIKGRMGRLSINFLCILISGAGLFLAGRQVWLQHFPPSDTSECGVSLQYMMQILPVNQVIQKIFEGTAECTQRGWELMGLNMAEWALIWFFIFLITGLFLLKKELNR